MTHYCERELVVLEANEPAALGAAICELSADSELRERLGAAARRQVVDRFDVTARYDTVARVLCEAAGR